MKNLILPTGMGALLWLLVTGSPVFAQNMRVSYFGETLTHYGLRAGVEQPFGGSERTLANGRVARTEWLASVSLAVFRHPHNHLGLALLPEILWRHTGGTGWMVQAGLTPGVIRTFYEGKTFQPGPDGGWERVRFAGQWGALPGASLGGGWEFARQSGQPFTLYTGLSTFAQYPYNEKALGRFALEVGMIKKINR
jgi:hypothetical protein